MKLNHVTNERFHYNLEAKLEIKEVRFCLLLHVASVFGKIKKMRNCVKQNFSSGTYNATRTRGRR